MVVITAIGYRAPARVGLNNVACTNVLLCLVLIISFNVSYSVSCYNGTIMVSMLSTILDGWPLFVLVYLSIILPCMSSILLYIDLK